MIWGVDNNVDSSVDIYVAVSAVIWCVDIVDGGAVDIAGKGVIEISR